MKMPSWELVETVFWALRIEMDESVETVEDMIAILEHHFNEAYRLLH